jgi:hypothetical protein
MPCAPCRFASALHALRCHNLRPALCRNSGLGDALPCEEPAPLPQRPSLRSGFYCPSPSTLNRPHPSHSQAHPVFAAWRLIPDAFAVLVRLGDPRVVPCFRCVFLFDMPSSTTAGNPLAVCAQFLRQRHGPSPELERLGTPKKPHHPLQMGRTFAASLVRYSLRPAKLLATLADLTGYFSQPTVTFTSRLSAVRLPFPSLDITTVATERVPPAGPSPTGTAASIAAPSSFREFTDDLDGILFVEIDHLSPVVLRHFQARGDRVDRKNPARAHQFAACDRKLAPRDHIRTLCTFARSAPKYPVGKMSEVRMA